jgi:hypothetical protein
MLIGRGGDDETAVARLRERFNVAGIDAERLIILPSQPVLDYYDSTTGLTCASIRSLQRRDKQVSIRSGWACRSLPCVGDHCIPARVEHFSSMLD